MCVASIYTLAICLRHIHPFMPRFMKRCAVKLSAEHRILRQIVAFYTRLRQRGRWKILNEQECKETSYVAGHTYTHTHTHHRMCHTPSSRYAVEDISTIYKNMWFFFLLPFVSLLFRPILWYSVQQRIKYISRKTSTQKRMPPAIAGSRQKNREEKKNTNTKIQKSKTT